MIDPLDDFEQQNQINRYRNRLDDIHQMLAEIPEQHITVTSYTMNLAGPAPSPEPPLPGGDRLDITGPWSADATYGDEAPPRQVIVEWAQTVYDAHDQTPPVRLRFTQALVYLREKTPWLLASPWADTYRQEIDGVYGRLRALVPPEVDHTHDDRDQHEITSDMVVDALRSNPEHRITRREITIIFGVAASTVTTWRSRGLTTDARGTYRAGDILERLAA